MATNILAIVPRLNVSITTFTNASWTDSFPFVVAGSAAAYPSPNNIGNGSLSVSSVAPQAALGGYTVKIVAPANGATPAQIAVTAPDGTLVAIGPTGTAISAGGVVITVTAGSTPFAVNDSFSLGVLPTPLDVSGIAFALMLRPRTGDAMVSLSASTGTGTIANGGASGQAGLRVQTATMQNLPAGTYAYDLIASADGYDVVAYQGTVTHAQGVTARAA